MKTGCFGEDLVQKEANTQQVSYHHPATCHCLWAAKSKAHSLIWHSTASLFQVLFQKNMWAMQACNDYIPMATMKNKAILKAVTLTLSLQLIQQREPVALLLDKNTPLQMFPFERHEQIVTTG